MYVRLILMSAYWVRGWYCTMRRSRLAFRASLNSQNVLPARSAPGSCQRWVDISWQVMDKLWVVEHTSEVSSPPR